MCHQEMPKILAVPELLAVASPFSITSDQLFKQILDVEKETMGFLQISPQTITKKTPPPAVLRKYESHDDDDEPHDDGWRHGWHGLRWHGWYLGKMMSGSSWQVQIEFYHFLSSG